MSIVHSPAASTNLSHQCDWRCRNYPLQTCSDICGVIVLISAALVTSDKPLFQYLLGPQEKEVTYLKLPTQHSYYLRRVLMSWFAEGSIDIDYVRLQPNWHDYFPSRNDHSFCLRPDTAVNSNKKLRLSLNSKKSASQVESKTTPRSIKATSNEQSKGEKSSPSGKYASSPQSGKTTIPCSMNNTASHQASPIRRPSPSEKAPAPPQAGSTASPCSTNATNNQPSPLEKPSSSHTVPSSQAGGLFMPSSTPAISCSRFKCEACGLQLSRRNC